MRMEEEESPTPPRNASDIPEGSRVSEAWLDFADKSDKDGSEGLVGYRKAMPRARPRYALNPGLFNLGQDSPEFTQLGARRTPGTSAYASPPSTAAPQPTLASDASSETPFIDFDVIEQMTSLPSIEDTPLTA